MIAAVYARKSTEQTGVSDDQKSVTRQIEQARAYARRKGWTVEDAHVYVDDGISGAEFATRPGFLRLMNTLKPKAPFQTLIMSEESRLGREQIEVSYALKQLVTAGVRVFCYLTDTERTLNSPIEKVMLALSTMADEMEREKARQRTRDAMIRKAKAGHVTGGACFGYDNLVVTLPDGRRSHVERRVNEEEAAVVRRMFDLCAAGHGFKQIAYALNDAGARAPSPQRGRPAGWAPSSIREILHRPLYRGEIIYNRSQKCDTWGQRHQTHRGEEHWIRVPAPELRIVTEAQWAAAQARIAEARAAYMRGTNGQLYGHPERGTESKYLLVGLSRCGVCGGGLSVKSRSHGRHRAFYYVCTAYHLRGPKVCPNCQELAMPETDARVRERIGEQILSPRVLERVLARTLERWAEPEAPIDEAGVRHEIEALDRKIGHLTAAIADGEAVASIVEAIKVHEARRRALVGSLEVRQAQRRAVVTAGDVERRARKRLEEWRGMLPGQTAIARQVIRKLFDERLVSTPSEADGTPAEDPKAAAWARITGEATYSKLFLGILLPRGVASPTGFEPVFWP